MRAPLTGAGGKAATGRWKLSGPAGDESARDKAKKMPGYRFTWSFA